NIERLLEPDGILFVGHSEIIFFQQFGYKFIGHKHSFACRKSFDIQLKDTPKQKNITSEHLVKFRKDKINSEIKKSEKIINKNEENDLDILENVKRFANNGNFEQVELLMDLYQKKIKTNPKTYYLKGLICEAKNNTEQAEEWYNKALYLDPNNYESIVQLSLIYEKRGEDARAEIMKDRIKRLSINSDLKL
ncbi:MAG: chemotaxis protein methyltransferase WspC, partial [Bacteroidota bacterium]|nr:chemotaxis protein methyltransferase WspC [Bacteroidota bacterium]